MRIISKFHDYYDSVLKYGPDDHCVFVRESARLDAAGQLPADLAFMRPGLHAVETFTAKRAPLGIAPFVIAFCGKCYPGIRLTSSGLSGAEAAFDECYYDLASYRARMAALGHPIEPERRRHWRRWHYRMDSPTNHQDLTDFFTAERASAFEALVGRGAAILLCLSRRHSDDVELYDNPELTTLKFYQMFDAYSAFQELEMYLGGVLASAELPMPQFEDQIKAQQKGFDKHSFRRLGARKKGVGA